jgi:hypothetical protein
MSISMIAPPTLTGLVNGASGTNYTIGSDGTIAGVASQDVLALLRAGFRFVSGFVGKTQFLAPLPADLISIVAAVTPSNVALTIAAQPPQARKLQIRVVIGTTTTTAITAGNLALVYTDQDGNAVTENISLIANASVTLKSKFACGALTSATVSGYVASGSGTGNTVGIGLSNDFGIPTGPNVVDFALVKATKIITTVTGAVTAWARAVTDDVASTATVDAVARTVAPTTAPGTAGINDYEFSCFYDVPG